MADATELDRFRQAILDSAHRAIQQSQQLKARTDKVVATSRRLVREAKLVYPELAATSATRES